MGASTNRHQPYASAVLVVSGRQVLSLPERNLPPPPALRAHAPIEGPGARRERLMATNGFSKGSAPRAACTPRRSGEDAPRPARWTWCEPHVPPCMICHHASKPGTLCRPCRPQGERSLNARPTRHSRDVSTALRSSSMDRRAPAGLPSARDPSDSKSRVPAVNAVK